MVASRCLDDVAVGRNGYEFKIEPLGISMDVNKRTSWYIKYAVVNPYQSLLRVQCLFQTCIRHKSWVVSYVNLSTDEHWTWMVCTERVKRRYDHW